MARTFPGDFDFTALAGGADPAAVVFDHIESRLASFLTAGTAAFEVYDTIATRNKVWRTRGDRNIASGAGDANGFVRFERQNATTIRLQVYQDWSTFSSTGSNAPTVISNLAFAGGATINIWTMINETEFCIVTEENGNYEGYACGVLFRGHVDKTSRGIGFLTSGVSSGASVTIPIDRDLTGAVPANGRLAVGAKVWVWNLTAPGDTLGGAALDFPTVTAVNSDSVEVDSLAFDLVTGSIIGMDPSPYYQLNMASMVSFVTGVEADGSIGNITYAVRRFTDAGEVSLDPNLATGKSEGFHAKMGPSSEARPIRGIPLLFALFAEQGTEDPLGAPPDNLLRTDFDDTQLWTPFPGLGTVASFMPCLGPHT